MENQLDNLSEKEKARREKISTSMKGKNTTPKSEDMKFKLSQAKKGKTTNPKGVGRRHTEEEIRKISESNKGKHNGVNLGRKQSPETLAHLSEVRRGKKRSEETKAKMRKPHNCTTRAPMKTSTKEKISQANLGHPVSEETKFKVVETKRRNNSFNTSSDETKFYNLLISKFGKEDIETQYNKDPRYPFRCDFYIKSQDLFIEVNLHWTHGYHLFDPNNKEDLNKLKIWEEKAINSSYYQRAIYVWTELDPRKLKIAMENHLNFLIIYDKRFKEFDNFICNTNA